MSRKRTTTQPILAELDACFNRGEDIDMTCSAEKNKKRSEGSINHAAIVMRFSVCDCCFVPALFVVLTLCDDGTYRAESRLRAEPLLLNTLQMQESQ
jgi:hypothetical protein